MSKYLSFIFGIVVFFVVLNVGMHIVGPTTCKDGWHSLSIGRQGACSHHGGVNDFPQNMVGIFSVGSGLISGFYIQGLVDNRRKKKELEIYVKEHKNDPFCPVHKIHMVKRFGRRGEFWGCSKYPHCKYTKNI